MSPYCSALDEWLIMKLCMYVGYHDANNMSHFGGDPVTQFNLKKNVLQYYLRCFTDMALHSSGGCYATTDRLQHCGRPYQPKHNPSLFVTIKPYAYATTSATQLAIVFEKKLKSARWHIVFTSADNTLLDLFPSVIAKQLFGSPTTRLCE